MTPIIFSRLEILWFNKRKKSLLYDTKNFISSNLIFVTCLYLETLMTLKMLMFSTWYE